MFVHSSGQRCAGVVRRAAAFVQILVGAALISAILAAGVRSLAQSSGDGHNAAIPPEKKIPAQVRPAADVGRNPPGSSIDPNGPLDNDGLPKDAGGAGQPTVPSTLDPNGTLDNSGVQKENPGAADASSPADAPLIPAPLNANLAVQSDAGSGPAGPAAVKPAPVAPSQALGIAFQNLPEVRLEALGHAALLQQDQQTPAPGKKLRISVGRELIVNFENGQWNDIVGVGRVWAVDVVSAGAVGLRLHFADVDLPLGAMLYVYAPSQPAYVDGPHQQRGPLGDGQFWAGTIEGERARIELFVPDPSGAGKPVKPLRVDQLQHLYRDPLNPAPGGDQPEGTACENDVTCFSAFTNVSHAVARISFVEGGNGFLCSGSLVNPQNGDLTPYFLTANHCIDTNAVAQTTQFFWLYQTSTCNGTPPSLASVPKSSIGTLLFTTTATDFTLLMEEGALPCGLFWEGFTASTISNGTASACIHHPGGTFKRISFGNRATADNSFCSSGDPNFLRINWTDGVTEPGSSGSPILRNSDQRVYGQLFCGPSNCGPGGLTYDNFGALDQSYADNATVQTLFAGGSDDALEPNDTCATAITISEGTFTNRIVKFNHDDWFRTNVPAGGSLAVTLTFTDANGDIDLELWSACGGSLLASSTGTTNVESIAFTNSGGAANFFIHVFLADCDTRNSYTMVISTTLVNDTCATATEIPGTATAFNPTPYSTIAANASGSEPQESCEAGGVGVSNTVWYSFTPCTSGTITVNTIGSNYDTVLSIFTGTCSAATQVACNDDIGGGNLQSQIVNFSVSGGTTYLIKVADYDTGSDGGLLDFNFSYSPNPPPNDLCTGPAEIFGNLTSFNPTPYCTVGANAVSSDPQEDCGSTTNSNSVFYSFTACGDGTISVNTNGSSYDTVLSIFTGSCLSTAHDCCVSGGAGCADPSIQNCVCAADPFCCNSMWDGLCAGEVTSLSCGTCPLNDHSCCATGAAGCDNNDVEACVCAQDAFCCGTSWDGVCVSEVDSLDCGTCSTPSQVACDDDSGTGLNSQISNLPVTAGTTYLIKVADFGNPNGGMLDFNFSYNAVAPANDHCANASVIPGNTTSFNPDPYCTVGADATLAEPQESCEVGGVGVSNTVWYQFTPECTGTLNLDTNGSNYDTVLSVFSGTCAAAVQVACDDDSGSGTNSQLTNVPVTAGTAYLIKVADYGGPNGGTLRFHFSYSTPAPVNDTCATATLITTASFNPAVFCTVGANATLSEPQESCEFFGAGVSNTVWYRVVPTQNGFINANTFGSDYDTVLSVFSGTCAAAVQVACNDDTNTLQSQVVNVPVTAGTTYFIKVAQFGGPGGGLLDFNFALTAGALVNIASANPPTVSPYIAGQKFRDVLQNSTIALVPQGIGAAGTPASGAISYAPIAVTFSAALSPTLVAANVVRSCTDLAGNGQADCPNVTTVTGSGAGPYMISLSAPPPPRECITFTFPGTNAGQKLQYQVLPGDVNLDGTSNTVDLLALVQALNNGSANLIGNLARYNIDRSAGGSPVNTSDLLRLVQLLNGTQATQVFNGATVAGCP
ncbi:MAG TPA: hypothetical protein VGM03_03835 [Phycisphaerae bacterium]|jgi:predicted RNA-binding protein with TRAM domain